MSTDKSIMRSAGVVSLATVMSRILGFIRDVVIARLFGVYIYAQAFVIAFRIPNLFRDLVGEGATNAVLVPVFSEYQARRSKEEFWELANVVLNILLITLTAIVLLGILFSPVIVRLIAPGFGAEPDKFLQTVRLNRLIFPYILLISLTAYSMGILNSLRHFAVPAFAPCLLNISIILFVLAFGEGIRGLALGILVGGFLQLAVQIPVLYKKGFRLRLFRRFRHPETKTIGRLMLPRLGSSAIYQLNNFIDSIFGSLAWIVGEGGVAVLYFSYRLVHFPLGIFSNALFQVILPTFSAQALETDRTALKQTLAFGLRAVFFLLLPASVGLAVLARPIIWALFQGGMFDAYSTQMTARALVFYSIGLCAYGATKILHGCFFALKDTATPAKVAFVALITNIILNAILMWPLQIAGIALATSISGINTFIILFVVLKKRLGDFYSKDIFSSFTRIFAASLGMGLVCYCLAQKNFTGGNVFINKFGNLSLKLIAGCLSYILFCFIFGVREMRELWSWLITQKAGHRRIK
jgi:putative peptidoglycan lipid II flippase